MTKRMTCFSRHIHTFRNHTKSILLPRPHPTHKHTPPPPPAPPPQSSRYLGRWLGGKGFRCWWVWHCWYWLWDRIWLRRRPWCCGGMDAGQRNVVGTDVVLRSISGFGNKPQQWLRLQVFCFGIGKNRNRCNRGVIFADPIFLN